MIGPSAPAPRRPHAGLAAALALVLGAGGCSFGWAKPPPRPADWPNPVLPSTSEQQCTTTVGPAVVDTVGATVFGLIAYRERYSLTFSTVPGIGESSKGLGHFEVSNEVTRSHPDYFARGIALTMGIGALTAVASAIYGYVNASRCSRYKALFNQ